MLISHHEIVQVSKQLVIISRRAILSVVLEVVRQTIVEEYGSLWMKTKPHIPNQGLAMV